MAITTRAVKGSKLTIAEGDTNFTDLNAGALVTVRANLSQGSTYTTPDGTGCVVSTINTQTYNMTFKFPATPIVNQILELSNPTIYDNGEITLNGNGFTVNGVSKVNLYKGWSFSWRYNATDGWVPTHYNPLFSDPAVGVDTYIGHSLAGGGFRISYGQSCDLYLKPNIVWSQGTASGLNSLDGVSGIFHQTQNTIDPTNTTANNGRYSYSGFVGTINNSSIAFGGGATNDVPVTFGLTATCRAETGSAYRVAAAPAGKGLHFAWKNAPMYIGDLSDATSGLCGVIDYSVGGHLQWKKMVIDESEGRNTGTADFTVANGISTQILAGSGTVAVTFPTTPVDKQTLTITLETAYTLVTFAAAGTIVGTTTMTAAGSFAKWRYRAANTTWHRVG